MLEKLLKMLEELGEDVSFDLFDYEDEDSILHVTVEDCEGFDEDWCEIMRKYDAEAIQNLIDWLEEYYISQKDGFEVRFDYSSYDI